MNIGSVTLCSGAERLLREEAVAGIKRLCIAAGFEETDFIRFSDPDTEPQAILEALRTAPFGSPRRLVVVDGLEEIAPACVPWLEDYLESPNPRSHLVLCADRSAGFRPGPQVQIIPCQPLKDKALEDWVSRRCLRKGKPIEPRAAAELVRRLGSGLQGLDLALDSLALMAEGSSVVRLAEVEALIPPSLRQTAFEILDLAASGKTDRAILALREALALGRIDRDQFMGALGWYLRTGWKAARSGGFSRLQRWPASRFQRMLEDLLRADAGIKQGHSSPEWLADQLLLKLR